MKDLAQNNLNNLKDFDSHICVYSEYSDACIDAKIYDLIAVLNLLGFTTFSSCEDSDFDGTTIFVAIEETDRMHPNRFAEILEALTIQHEITPIINCKHSKYCILGYSFATNFKWLLLKHLLNTLEFAETGRVIPVKQETGEEL